MIPATLSKTAFFLLGLLLSASAWIPAATTSTRNNNNAVLHSAPRVSSSSLFMSDDAPEAGTGKGTVKWFDTMKGFGFIAPDDGSSDVFVHQTAIRMEGFRSLADGEPVEYKVETDSNTGRMKAIDVTGPNGGEVQGAPFRPDNDYQSY